MQFDTYDTLILMTYGLLRFFETFAILETLRNRMFSSKTAISSCFSVSVSQNTFLASENVF